MLPDPSLPAYLPAFIEVSDGSYTAALEMTLDELASAGIAAMRRGDLEMVESIQAVREYLLDL